MSAYLVAPEQLGIMVSVFGNESKYTDKDSRNYYANQIEDLANANLMSIGIKYEKMESGVPMTTEEKDEVCRTWMSIGYGEYMLKAMSWFHKCYADPMGRYKKYSNPVQVLKYCRNFEYQSCEFDGWKDSEGFRVCNWVQGRAMDKLEGYEDAQWGFQYEPEEKERVCDDNVYLVSEMGKS